MGSNNNKIVRSAKHIQEITLLNIHNNIEQRTVVDLADTFGAMYRTHYKCALERLLGLPEKEASVIKKELSETLSDYISINLAKVVSTGHFYHKYLSYEIHAEAYSNRTIRRYEIIGTMVGTMVIRHLLESGVQYEHLLNDINNTRLTITRLDRTFLSYRLMIGEHNE